jgi:hypothetical protein
VRSVRAGAARVGARRLGCQPRPDSESRCHGVSHDVCRVFGHGAGSLPGSGLGPNYFQAFTAMKIGSSSPTVDSFTHVLFNIYTDMGGFVPLFPDKVSLSPTLSFVQSLVSASHVPVPIGSVRGRRMRPRPTSAFQLHRDCLRNIHALRAILISA